MNNAAEVLALLDKHTPRPGAVSKIGLTAAQVRAVAAKFKPVEMPTPAEARIGLARHTRRMKRGQWGRRGLPEYIWRAMYQQYCAGNSCADVAAIFGGTRQSVHEIFKVRRLQLRPIYPRRLAMIDYCGVSYTPSKDGYYRATSGDRRMLHHKMWEDANGPIPEGWQVLFRNADNHDLRLVNLNCMPIAAVTRYHLERARRTAA